MLLKTYLFKRKHKNGIVSWRIRWRDPRTRRWKSLHGGRNREEAQALESYVRQELIKGKDPSSRYESHELTVSGAIDAFLAHARFLSGSERWRFEVSNKIKNDIRPQLGKFLFFELTQDRIFKFYLALKSRSISNATIDKYHRLLCLIGDVYAELTCDVNPVRNFKDFRKRFPNQASTRDINFLTPEELEKLYREVKRSPNRLLFPLVLFLASTGLRRTEALNLKWTDVDEIGGFIHIRISKNGRHRTIPLEAEARQALKYLPGKGLYLFAGPDGHRYYQDSFLRPLQRAARRAGIQKRIDIHCLRHSYGSNKIQIGRAHV